MVQDHAREPGAGDRVSPPRYDVHVKEQWFRGLDPRQTSALVAMLADAGVLALDVAENGKAEAPPEPQQRDPLLSHEPELPAGTIKCPECPFTAPDERRMNMHRGQMYRRGKHKYPPPRHPAVEHEKLKPGPKPKAEPAEPPLIHLSPEDQARMCPEKDFVAATPEGLQAHIRTHHPELVHAKKVVT